MTLTEGQGPRSLGSKGQKVEIVLRITRFKLSYRVAQFRVVIKLDVWEILHGRPGMLTRDLFAMANLLVLLY